MNKNVSIITIGFILFFMGISMIYRGTGVDLSKQDYSTIGEICSEIDKLDDYNCQIVEVGHES